MFLRHVQAANPADFWANLIAGNALVYTSPHEAAAYYRAVLASRPQAAVGYCAVWAEAVRFEHYYDLATDYYRKAIELDPGYVPAYNNLGDVLGTRGSWTRPSTTTAGPYNSILSICGHTRIWPMLCEARASLTRCMTSFSTCCESTRRTGRPRRPSEPTCCETAGDAKPGWSGRRCFNPTRSSTRPGLVMPSRVEMWCGGVRLGISVSGPFGCRCLTSLAMAPFPHPAHQTGRAVFRHPAFGQGFTTSAASHVRPRTVGVRSVEAGIIPASGADSGHRTVSFHYPAP